MTVSEWIAYVDQRVWGPGMLVLLMGTGVFLTLRTRFLPWRNLGWALKSVLGRDSRAKAGGAGDVSPFSTILGWEFCGETAFAFLFGRRAIPLYRILFALAAFLGATQSLEVVWNLSDIFNALMAVPNLISLLLLSGTAARELEAFQPEIRRGRRLRQRRAVRRAL